MKTCFKCNSTLPLSEFYTHKMMRDRYVGKCKACTRADVMAYAKAMSKNLEWAEKERERHRLKQQRRRLEGKDKKLTPEKKLEVNRRHAARYPERDAARNAVANAVRDGKLKRQSCIICGSKDSEAHHEDYSKPLDIQWLCPKHHAERHREIRRLKRLAAYQTTNIKLPCQSHTSANALTAQSTAASKRPSYR